MLHVWLENALKVSGLKQADVSRALSEALGRSIDQNQISRMLKGQRKISGDELLELARICEFPIPLSRRTEPLSQSIPTLSAAGEIYPDNCEIQISIGSLRVELAKAILRLTPQLETQTADVFAEEVLFNLQRSEALKLILDSSDKMTSRAIFDSLNSMQSIEAPPPLDKRSKEVEAKLREMSASRDAKLKKAMGQVAAYILEEQKLALDDHALAKLRDLERSEK